MLDARLHFSKALSVCHGMTSQESPWELSDQRVGLGSDAEVGTYVRGGANSLKCQVSCEGFSLSHQRVLVCFRDLVIQTGNTSRHGLSMLKAITDPRPFGWFAIMHCCWFCFQPHEVSLLATCNVCCFWYVGGEVSGMHPNECALCSERVRFERILWYCGSDVGVKLSWRFLINYRIYVLNIHLTWAEFVKPRTLEGFCCATSLDQNMGYYHIQLQYSTTLFSNQLCIIVLLWFQKDKYQPLQLDYVFPPIFFKNKNNSNNFKN
jgi:hypothetical protein